MKNTIKKVSSVPDKLDLELHSRFLPHSANVVENTEYILNSRQRNNPDRKILCINGSEFTSEIIILNNKNLNDNPILLAPGIDGVIMETNKEFELIMPVADCCSIAAYNKSGEISGLFHAGYKGVSGEAEKGLGMLDNMFDKLGILDELKDFNFYLSPMIGDDFELPLDYVRRLFKRIFEEYGLDEEKYFYSHNLDKEKIYLDLKTMILDIFEYYQIKRTAIKNKNSKVTNNPDSVYLSYRLHTIAKSIEKKASEKEFELQPSFDNELYGLDENSLPQQELDLLISGKVKKYLTDYRLALVLKNKTS